MYQKSQKPPFISVAELAKLLGISRVAVFKRIKKGKILAHKIGRAYAIPLEEVSGITQGSAGSAPTEYEKREIGSAVERAVREYGVALRLLGKE